MNEKKNTGDSYTPGLHRIKVLYSVRVTPDELRHHWERDHSPDAFTIRDAINSLRSEMESAGISIAGELAEWTMKNESET